MVFANRTDAGRRLAARLASLPGDVVVLALPRGGVPVAAEVARALHAPLDVIVVRKVGVPTHPELAMGAVGEDGVQIVNDDVVRVARVTRAQWDEAAARARQELEGRVQRFRRSAGRVPLTGRTAVLVDDGVATGATALAACHVARAHGAARVVVAVPVASDSAVEALRDAADEVICLDVPPNFRAVGQWYEDFSQTTDDEVAAILHRMSAPPGPSVATEVAVPVGSARLAGDLTVPEAARVLVVFAHGSGSSRHSPRNRRVAEVLNEAGLGTLLLDLLTPAEERDRANVFDVELLGSRLVAVTQWLRAETATRHLDVAYFGASTGAAAALWAAAEERAGVVSVVSRGGRPDLAGDRLPAVTAPTLLVVGGRDEQVLALNRQAASRLRCEHRLAVVPGATHLFEEPGALQVVAELAVGWFTAHQRASARPSPGSAA